MICNLCGEELNDDGTSVVEYVADNKLFQETLCDMCFRLKFETRGIA